MTFISDWEKTVDPLSSLFSVFAPILQGGFGKDYVHDGLVRVRDAKRGQFWGCVPADHTDEIGQILGASPGFGNNWKYLDFYTQVIAYMRSRGY